MELGESFRSNTVALPQLLIKQSAVEHNIVAMQEFCVDQGIVIAPHAKTTMAPWIIRRQLEGHGWGVTVATLDQLQVCLGLGARRVIVANEIASTESGERLGRMLEAREDQRVYVLVDSPEGVRQLAAGLERVATAPRLRVLLEVGTAGGRAGCRSTDAATAVARAVAKEPTLELAGVEGFEGILGSSRAPAELARVDEYLGTMITVATALQEANAFDGVDEILLSAGGSVFFDRVAESLPAARFGRPHRVVIRSGCYVVHDHGHLARPMSSQPGGGLFLPALELWSEVLSTPERGMAIAGFGKRDAPFDAGLPVLLGRVPVGSQEMVDAKGAKVTALNDQHAYIATGNGAELQVGDRLVCGIIHPCTAFDKWRQVAVVDDRYRVTDIADTYFSCSL